MSIGCAMALALPATSTAAISPPSITSAFTPTSISVGGTSSLSYTIANPNRSGSLSGIALDDTLPAGLVVDNPNGESGTCGSASTISASSGASTISLSGGSLAAGATCTFSVNVTSSAPEVVSNSTGPVSSTNGGTGNSDTETLTVVGPPTISVLSPRNGARFNFGQKVILHFSCTEAANGPGLTDCSGTVDDSANELSSGSRLDTSVAGPHTFTVTAVSADGEVVSDSVNYRVRPDNRFTVSHVNAQPGGPVSFQLKLPGPGRVTVRELVISSGAGFAELTARATHAGRLDLTVPPDSSGRALLAAGPSQLAVRLVIEFTPKGGAAHTVTISGIGISP